MNSPRAAALTMRGFWAPRLALLAFALCALTLAAPGAALADASTDQAAAAFSSGHHAYASDDAYTSGAVPSKVGRADIDTVDQQIAATHHAIYVAVISGTAKPADLHAAYGKPGVYVTVDAAGVWAHGYDVPKAVADAAPQIAKQGTAKLMTGGINLQQFLTGYVTKIAAVRAQPAPAQQHQASGGGGGTHTVTTTTTTTTRHSNGWIPWAIFGGILFLIALAALALYVRKVAREMREEQERSEEESRAYQRASRMSAYAGPPAEPRTVDHGWSQPAERDNGEYSVGRPAHNSRGGKTAGPAPQVIRDDRGRDHTVVVNNSYSSGTPHYWGGGNGFGPGYYSSPVNDLIGLAVLDSVLDNNPGGGGYDAGYRAGERDADRDQGTTTTTTTTTSSDDGGSTWADTDTDTSSGNDDGGGSSWSSGDDGGSTWSSPQPDPDPAPSFGGFDFGGGGGDTSSSSDDGGSGW